MLFATACGPADSVLLMAGRSWLSLWNTTIALVLSIGLNLVLIPAAGSPVPRVTWAVATIVRNILPVLQLRHFERLRPESLIALRVARVERGAVRCAPVGGESHEPPTRHGRPVGRS